MDEKQQDEFVETFGEELGEEIDIEATRKAHKMSMTGWALFFIWLGIVFSLNLGASVGMLGAGRCAAAAWQPGETDLIRDSPDTTGPDSGRCDYTLVCLLREARPEEQVIPTAYRCFVPG